MLEADPHPSANFPVRPPSQDPSLADLTVVISSLPPYPPISIPPCIYKRPLLRHVFRRGGGRCQRSCDSRRTGAAERARNWGTRVSAPGLSRFSPQPSVVDRVAGMPLISSTCNMVSAAYTSTKESYPHVKTVCDVAERGVKTLTAAAVSGAQPILSKLEPQITSASGYAHRGLDKLEENLPILQQQPEKVLADTKELVSSKVLGAREAVSSSVSSAKDTVATHVTEAVDMTRSTVQSGVDMTKSMVASGVHSVMGSRVGQMVLSGVDTVLGKSETWVDNHLPMTDAELAALATSLEGFDIATVQQQRQEQSYFVRLGALSERLRQRAYEHSLGKLQHTRQRAQEGLAQLTQALSLQVESQVLTMVRDMAQQLQATCASLGSSIQGLPAHVKDQAQQARRQVEDLQATFSGIHSFQDLSGSVLTQSRERAAKAREALDHMVEYVAQNTPVMWLVGPFAPGVVEKTPEEKK
ncbi:Perilipin-3 [Galemys pyrenaicus]|uniref:Perilipin-3 n=1 Tax=Galemys pyrenaicus TaxID=202257 RepID=A0A8J6DSJ0_GALPY|nr:Perilipin-3 [Galemys pyrenaicus]